MAASKASSPTPGQEKTISTTVAPVSNRTAIRPKKVSGGMEPGLRACFQITWRLGRPLSRASFTYSVPRVSSIEDRNSRSRAAIPKVAMTRLGSSMLVQPSCPEVGTQPRFTANTQISMMASQNSGTDWPNRAIPLATRSSQELRRTAERMPRGTPTSTVRASATAPSCSDTGRRSAITLPADSSGNLNDGPKSPCRALPRKVRY